MSDLAATHCDRGFNNGISGCLLLILILCCCGNNNGFFGGSGCGNDDNGCNSI